ncbi:TIGR04197 family type VII secretion effector [Salipaludibacillus sp. HK11]|uniref:TIGR04197 family type VII secretion effector n=1 Tax=Salipaludibacillus sp. HK11 TaxID=3394320 RepID=UPI0039FD7255
MSKEVSINVNVFRSNVSKFKTSISSIESNKTFETFSKTNIEPFTKDLESVSEVVELLKLYKSVLNNDIVRLENTGESLKETDEELARVNHNHTGTQMIR